jgi:hypothetical protein
LALAHSRNFAILTWRGGINHSCFAFCPPASTYSWCMSSARYRLIWLVSSIPFMLHSFCLYLGCGFSRRASGRCRLSVAATDAGSRRFNASPRLGSAAVQITRPALDFFQRNLSPSGCRTTQTLTPHQRPCGGISSRIRGGHIPSKFILLTLTVGPPEMRMLDR